MTTGVPMSVNSGKVAIPILPPAPVKKAATAARLEGVRTLPGKIAITTPITNPGGAPPSASRDDSKTAMGSGQHPAAGTRPPSATTGSAPAAGQAGAAQTAGAAADAKSAAKKVPPPPPPDRGAPSTGTPGKTVVMHRLPSSPTNAGGAGAGSGSGAGGSGAKSAVPAGSAAAVDGKSPTAGADGKNVVSARPPATPPPASAEKRDKDKDRDKGDTAPASPAKTGAGTAADKQQPLERKMPTIPAGPPRPKGQPPAQAQAVKKTTPAAGTGAGAGAGGEKKKDATTAAAEDEEDPPTDDGSSSGVVAIGPDGRPIETLDGFDLNEALKALSEDNPKLAEQLEKGAVLSVVVRFRFVFRFHCLCVFLSENSNPCADEAMVRDLRAQIITASRRNFILERELSEIDEKIKLLIKNRISVQEVIAQQQGLELAGHDSKVDSTSLSASGKLQLYEDMFYLLQSRPQYFAKLARLLPAKDIAAFVQTVVFDMYGDQYDTREERLLLTLFGLVLQAELTETTDQGSLLRANTAITQMLSAYARRGQGLSILKVCV